jgi:outer membrane protein assembly factor BamB
MRDPGCVGAVEALGTVVANGIFYIGSGDENLYAIDATTGKEKWRTTKGDWVYSSPAVANGVVYVGSGDKNLYAIDAVTGKEQWRFATGGRVDSSPAVANGVVYVGSEDKNLYAVGTNSVSLTTVPTTIPSTYSALPGTPSQQTIASVQTISPLSGQNTEPTVTLPIPVTIGAILLAGGGYILYRLKNKQ